jgi:5-methylcytosine-specific restriction endonuclease McrA
MARKVAKRRDKYRCVKCGSKQKLEVNHIKPCLGKHGKKGCWHHISNLETLCHECHLVVTSEQRKSGKLTKKRKR